MIEAFEEFLKTLTKPMQDQIRDSMKRNESITFKAFKAGYEANADSSRPTCALGDKCVCGGDTQGVREGCSSFIKGQNL